MSDPQSCRGGPEALAKVAEWVELCMCGHAMLWHDLGSRKGRSVRTWCSIMTAAGPCGCKLYADAGSTPS